MGAAIQALFLWLNRHHWFLTVVEFFVVLLLMSGAAILCVPAWLVARKDGRWYTTDYISMFGPVPLWLMLYALRIGPMSLSNLLEVLVVIVVVPILVSLRVVALDRVCDPKRSSVVVCGAAMLFPLLLRLTVPPFAE